MALPGIGAPWHSILVGTAGQPDSIAGLAQWLKADDGLYTDTGLSTPVASDGDLVAGWQDKSGSGRHMTQSTSGNRPAYKVSILNSKPVVRFDGSNDVLAGANLTALSAAEAFIVVKIGQADPPPSGSGTGLWHYGSDPQATHYPYSDGNVYDNFGTNSRKGLGNPTPALDAFRLYNVTTKSGGWTARIDGTQVYTTASNTVGFRSSCELGSGLSGSGPAFIGDVAEVIIYSAELSAGDRDVVEAYIAAKYGLTIA